MKVDSSKVKKGSTELTAECSQLIADIKQCSTSTELLHFLEKTSVWVYGKCELYHWVETLDRFDDILEEAAKRAPNNEFMLQCDMKYSEEDTYLLLAVLHFTTLLIEHSFSRHLYNSVEHLTELLSSENMDIVLAVLNLLYMFSKRSNFIPRLPLSKKEPLLRKLLNIAERWGDPNNGLSLKDCCLKKPKYDFLYQMSVEYTIGNEQITLEVPNMKLLCSINTPNEIIQILCEGIPNPPDDIKMRIAHRVKLVSGFKKRQFRLQFVQARLQAISVLIYSNALQDNVEKVLYTGFGEELCELIDRKESYLTDIRAAVLRTLTSMLHFDRSPNVPRPGSRLAKVICYTGAERQTGMLPILVKDCIMKLTSDVETGNYPLPLATSLFSLLYHLASYESGGQALIKSGMMQSLLQVLSWTGADLEYIIFVTRAVRVIDLITNIDISTFHQNNGINVFIERLEKEISICRNIIENEFAKEQTPFQDVSLNSLDLPDIIASDKSCDNAASEEYKNLRPREGGDCAEITNNSIKETKLALGGGTNSKLHKNMCVTQRAALLKSILNFLKKSIQDHAHFNGTRNIMDSSLPNCLHHIIFNAEYYGPSLFLLATDVITVYVFNEPSLLSSLQDSGLTKVILQSLLEKEVPATREVLASLPNVFSALCLNERGLMEFISYKPFDKILKVLLSPDYLVAMRRRRSSDHLGDTATNLGNAMDDLMKHHPYLRTDAVDAIIRLLTELVHLGTDRIYTCWRVCKDNSTCYSYNKLNMGLNTAHSSGSYTHENNIRRTNDTDGNDSSEGDVDDDEEIATVCPQQTDENKMNVSFSLTSSTTSSGGGAGNGNAAITSKSIERQPIPLIDYILNVMKFIEAILSNSTSKENCRQFVLRGGVMPLMQLLSLPNLPVDAPVSTSALAVANVTKSIFNLTHETKVLEISLQQLFHIINQLEPLIEQFNFSKGSVLFRELFSCGNINEAFVNAELTPILHRMNAVHGYVIMLINLCRNASNEMRSILLKQWGDREHTGIQLLDNLVKLYISLVWESTILLSMCSEDSFIKSSLPHNWNSIITFSSESMDTKQHHYHHHHHHHHPTLQPANYQQPHSSKNLKVSTENTSTNELDADYYQNLLNNKMRPEQQLRYIKCLLAASSRLGRTLAELFGTLVNLSVGTPQIRPRRLHDIINNATYNKFPSTEAVSIARVLSSILVNSFCHKNLLTQPAAKLKLTFLICSVGFTGPMLFDEKRNAFHLMIFQFCQQNGVKAFFDMFYWALSINMKNPILEAHTSSLLTQQFGYEVTLANILEDTPEDKNDFPEGSGEFLYAWLQLLEKMANPRGLLETPYIVSSMVNDDSVQFEPIFYLIQVHNLAIYALRRIWSRKPLESYGVLMTVTIVTILKHLVKSRHYLKDQYQIRIQELHSKNQNSAFSNKLAMGDLSKDGLIFKNNFKILMDMGFERKHIVAALRNTSSLELAMDYILNCTETSQISDSLLCEESSIENMQTSNNKMDTDSCEAANNLLSSTSTKNSDLTTLTTQATKSTATTATTPLASQVLTCPKIGEFFLITDDIFYKFCDEIVQKIFELMSNIPDIITSGAELIYVLYSQNRPQEKERFTTKFANELKICCDEIRHILGQAINMSPENLEIVISGHKGTNLLTRLKVYTMLLDEKYYQLRKDFCKALADNNSLYSIVMLLSQTELLLTNQQQLLGGEGIQKFVPIWLHFIIEFIDKYDIVSNTIQQKMNTLNLIGNDWRWYDISCGKWNTYSDVNNVIIRNAFNSGERTVNIYIGRQRYTINFNTMTQISESYGSHRPISPSLELTDLIMAASKDKGNSGNGSPSKSNTFDAICTYIIRPTSGENNNSEDNVVCKSLFNMNDVIMEKRDDKKANTSTTASSATGSSNSCPLNPEGKNMSYSKLSDMWSNRHASRGGFCGSTSGIVSGNGQHKKYYNIIINEQDVGLANLDNCAIISSLVRLLHLESSLQFDTKLAILRLCARLTKNYLNAELFYKSGGLNVLLKMQQFCETMIYPTYPILIIRHLLEAPKLLQDVFERVLVSKTSQHISSSRRDLTFVLSQLSAAVSRSKNVFLNTVKNVVLYEDSMSSGSKFHVDDSKFIIKSRDMKFTENLETSLEDIPALKLPIRVIRELLKSLAQPCTHYGATYSDQYDSSGDITMQNDDNIPPRKEETKYEPCCCCWHLPCNGQVHQKPLISRATLLKLLADCTRSYQMLVPRILVNYVYRPKDSVLIREEQSFLSFILDNFLPIIRPEQNSEVSMLSRVLISAIADSCTQISIQNKLADEIVNAIVRALLLKDTTEKHTRLQVLIGLLPVIIDSPVLSYKNYMFEILIKKGVLTSLIKIAQCTDLSNQKTISTIQSILRPIDIMLRIAVSPVSISSHNMRIVPFEPSTVMNHHRLPRGNRINRFNSSDENYTLRNIIRSVFSERRQMLNFIFNGDNMITGAVAVNPTIRLNNGNDLLESNRTNNFNEDPLDFDRLWNEMLQSGNVPTSFSGNISGSVASGQVETLNENDHRHHHHHHHHHHPTTDDTDNANANISVVGGSSDGTSTPSENTPVIIDNRDVSTSETDSDSNVSTENEDNNNDDDEEDEEHDESSEGQREADGDATRQYIEVFDHVYIPESETASNDPDMDAEDDSAYIRSLSSVLSQEDTIHNNISTAFITGPPNNSSNNGNNREQHAHLIPLERHSSEQDRPTIQFLTTSNANISSFTSGLNSYLSFVDQDERQNVGRQNIDGNNDGVNNFLTTVFGRETNRRMIFLDQQYCTPLPTFQNPTEEGQVEAFSQDALHWWVEEAKYFDAESYVDICMQVRHHLVMHLLNKVKDEFIKKRSENKNRNDSRKSSIPVLIQGNSKQQASTANNMDMDKQICSEDERIGKASELVTSLSEDPTMENNSNFSSLSVASSKVNDGSNENQVNADTNNDQSDSSVTLNCTEMTNVSNYKTETTTAEVLNLEELAAVVTEEKSEEREMLAGTSTDSNGQDISDSSTHMSLISLQDNIEDVSSEEEQEEEEVDEDDDEEENLFPEENTLLSLSNNETASMDIQNATNNDVQFGDGSSVPSNINIIDAISVGSEMAQETVISNTSMVSNGGNQTVFIANLELDANQANMNVTNSGDSLITITATTTTTPISTSDTIGEEVIIEAAPSDALIQNEITPELRAVLGDIEIPAGVDPSFLAALPVEIREEVIQEHLRMNRVNTRTQQSDVTTTPQTPLPEVSAEFLAALPPNIQTEVLMQQRMEQQRRAAQSINPEDPVDTVAFFQNLPEALRQAILTDMEDSQISSLPPELAAEAQHLRRDWETRSGRRADMQTNSLNGYTGSGNSNGLSTPSHDASQMQHHSTVWCNLRGINPIRHQHSSIMHSQQQSNLGKPLALILMEELNNLFDPDSLATLLLFLFIDSNEFNHNRLYTILRNISYHAPTREWIINALISIIKNADGPCCSTKTLDRPIIQPKWLKLKVDAAFGFKSNTFILDVENNGGLGSIKVNPQAAQQVVKNCLNLLFVLAKQFPRSFIPVFTEKRTKKSVFKSRRDLPIPLMRVQTNISNPNNVDFMAEDIPSTSKAAAAAAAAATSITKSNQELTTSPISKFDYNTNGDDFWTVLWHLDSTSTLRMNHMKSFPTFNQVPWEWKSSNSDNQSFGDMPFTKLLDMLSYKLIRRSPQLTDLLLKLLAHLSPQLPEEDPRKPNELLKQTTTSPTTNTTGTNATAQNNASGISNAKTTTKSPNDPTSSVNNTKIETPFYSQIFSHFKILIEVLTHKCGTNEGLENIARIIQNICQCSYASNVILSQYLRHAILGLAEAVQKEIQYLLEELEIFSRENAARNITTGSKSAINTMRSGTSNISGLRTMQTEESPTTAILGLNQGLATASLSSQITAIKLLMASSSAQVYFLRTLKIFLSVYMSDNLQNSKQKQCMSEILPLDQLWIDISKCLMALEESKDEYTVLVLQPSVEAFFLIHASYDPPNSSETTSNNVNETDNTNTGLEATTANTVEGAAAKYSGEENMLNEKRKLDRQRFLQFAEKHRKVLNQILRQSPVHLSDGPFAVLVDHTRILDFDVKRKYFYTELERMDEGVRREENTVSVRRASVFEDSFRALYRLGPDDWKNRFYIVFEDEEGQDAGGLLREWYIIISREIFNPMYALFCVCPGDRVTYMINPSSYANPNHLSYFKFVGRVIAKAVHDNKLLECYFTRAFYKHILGKQVKYTDMESQDYEFYKGLAYLMENNISTLGYDLTFSTEVQEFGVTQIRDLVPNGRNVIVTEGNKFDYVQLVCQLKMSGSIRQQLDAFLEGFYDIIPKSLISIFNEQELELLISGLPDIDIEDLRANTEYHKYTPKSSQIQWFWRALRSFDQADRARFLQFVTGTSKVPLQGFGSLEGMNGTQKFQIHRDDRSTDRLPCAHTCFNQLDLPMYKSYEKLRSSLLKAIHECSEGFGFA